MLLSVGESFILKLLLAGVLLAGVLLAGVLLVGVLLAGVLLAASIWVVGLVTGVLLDVLEVLLPLESFPAAAVVVVVVAATLPPLVAFSAGVLPSIERFFLPILTPVASDGAGLPCSGPCVAMLVSESGEPSLLEGGVEGNNGLPRSSRLKQAVCEHRYRIEQAQLLDRYRFLHVVLFFCFLCCSFKSKGI